MTSFELSECFEPTGLNWARKNGHTDTTVRWGTF